MVTEYITQQIYSLLDKIHKNEDDSKLKRAVIINLSKVFNTLGQSQHLAKLKQGDLEDIELEWLTNYLFWGAQAATENEKMSKPYLDSATFRKDQFWSQLNCWSFYDFSEILKNSKTTQFENETVNCIFVKNVDGIKFMLNEDL